MLRAIVGGALAGFAPGGGGPLLLIPALTLLVAPLGALWGGLVAGTAGALVGLTVDAAVALGIGAVFGVAGAVTGALLLSLIWLPYAFQVVMRQPRWPTLAVAGLLAPVLPFLTFAALLLLAGL